MKPLSFVVPPVGQSLFPGAIISPFAGYGFFNESLRGTVPGSDEFPVNSQGWQFVRVGAKAELPLNFDLVNSFYHPTLTVSGAFNPWVQTQSSTFTGTGTGFQLAGNLSFPLNGFVSAPNPSFNGYNVDFFVKYTSMRASGEINGLIRTPFDARNDNTTFGVNLRTIFGDTLAPPPPPR